MDNPGYEYQVVSFCKKTGRPIVTCPTTRDRDFKGNEPRKTFYTCTCIGHGR